MNYGRSSLLLALALAIVSASVDTAIAEQRVAPAIRVAPPGRCVAIPSVTWRVERTATQSSPPDPSFPPSVNSAVTMATARTVDRDGALDVLVPEPLPMDCNNAYTFVIYLTRGVRPSRGHHLWTLQLECVARAVRPNGLPELVTTIERTLGTPTRASATADRDDHLPLRRERVPRALARGHAGGVSSLRARRVQKHTDSGPSAPRDCLVHDGFSRDFSVHRAGHRKSGGSAADRGGERAHDRVGRPSRRSARARSGLRRWRAGARIAARVGATGAVLGVDPSPTAIERARARAREGGLTHARFEAISAEDLAPRVRSSIAH